MPPQLISWINRLLLPASSHSSRITIYRCIWSVSCLNEGSPSKNTLNFRLLKARLRSAIPDLLPTDWFAVAHQIRRSEPQCSLVSVYPLLRQLAKAGKHGCFRLFSHLTTEICAKLFTKTEHPSNNENNVLICVSFWQLRIGANLLLIGQHFFAYVSYSISIRSNTGIPFSYSFESIRSFECLIRT